MPLVVLGHSMGSFALQQYLLDRSADLDAAVLSGTSAMDVIGPGIDPDAEIDLSAFNAPFEPARTEYDWLSRDPDEVDKYVADPDCGFGVNAAGARPMLEGLAPSADPDRLAGIRSDLPIYVLSGEADPLAGGGPARRSWSPTATSPPASRTSPSTCMPVPATRPSTRRTATRSPPT